MNPDTTMTMTETDRQHEWDDTPHTIYEDVPVTKIELSDILMETHQVVGIARAEQRGQDAIRLDLEFVGGPSGEVSARMVFPKDHFVSDVKRYNV